MARKLRHFGFSGHAGNVAELLHKAAKAPWLESVLFRYSFRSYGDKELNAAIDAAHKAGVGLIAMKTQGRRRRRRGRCAGTVVGRTGAQRVRRQRLPARGSSLLPGSFVTRTYRPLCASARRR